MRMEKIRNPNLKPCTVVDCLGFRRTDKDSECDMCGTWHCAHCGISQHGRYHLRNTRKRTRRSEEDAGWDQYVSKVKTMRCPTCGHAVQRTDGCNTMTCSQCATIFCYRCGELRSNHEGNNVCG